MVSKDSKISLKSIHEKTYFQYWIILSLATFLGYLPFIFNFIWGNHDWQWIKEYTPLGSGLFEGRFSQLFLQNILFSGKILPIATLIISLMFLSLGTILLLRLWNIPPKKSLYILLGLNLICSPYSISWLYFSFITLSSFSWIFIITLAYTILNNFSDKPKVSVVTATLLFYFSLGGYPPVINFIALLFCTLVLNDLCFEKLTPSSILKKYIPHIISVISALTLFLITLYFLKKYHLQYDTYNTSEIKLSELLPKFGFSLKEGIKQFFETSPFIELPYKYLNLCIFLLSIIGLSHKLPKTISCIILYIIALVGLIFSSVITLFVSSNIGYVQNAPRIEFYGLLFIYIYAASILLKSKTSTIKNLTYLTLFYLLINNINTISHIQKVWLSGFVSENKLMERIISRIEDSPQFNPEKKYTFVQGGTLNFRTRFYNTKTNDSSNDYMLNAPYIPWHLPSKAYKFHYPIDFFAEDFDIFWSYVNPQKINMNIQLYEYLNNTATVWPKSNALFVDDNTIILTLTPDGKNRARYWLHNNL